MDFEGRQSRNELGMDSKWNRFRLWRPLESICCLQPESSELDCISKKCGRICDDLGDINRAAQAKRFVLQLHFDMEKTLRFDLYNYRNQTVTLF